MRPALALALALLASPALAQQPPPSVITLPHTRLPADAKCYPFALTGAGFSSSRAVIDMRGRWHVTDWTALAELARQEAEWRAKLPERAEGVAISRPPRKLSGCIADELLRRRATMAFAEAPDTTCPPLTIGTEMLPRMWRDAVLQSCMPEAGK